MHSIQDLQTVRLIISDHAKWLGHSVVSTITLAFAEEQHKCLPPAVVYPGSSSTLSRGFNYCNRTQVGSSRPSPIMSRDFIVPGQPQHFVDRVRGLCSVT
jgi:hypothetical protein